MFYLNQLTCVSFLQSCLTRVLQLLICSLNLSRANSSSSSYNLSTVLYVLGRFIVILTFICIFSHLLTTQYFHFLLFRNFGWIFIALLFFAFSVSFLFTSPSSKIFVSGLLLSCLYLHESYKPHWRSFFHPLQHLEEKHYLMIRNSFNSAVPFLH